jgi:hypothetical protein
MSDKFLPDISVGDLAMDLLKDMAKNPSQALKPALKESTLQNVGAPDVSKIQVSDDYVSLVLEGKKPQPKKPVTAIKESSEVKLGNLVERLSTLISEARQIMEEISSGATTTGNIGVNMAGKSKNNPYAICKSSVGKNKTAKLERCIMKLKGKYGDK